MPGGRVVSCAVAAAVNDNMELSLVPRFRNGRELFWLLLLLLQNLRVFDKVFSLQHDELLEAFWFKIFREACFRSYLFCQERLCH